MSDQTILDRLKPHATSALNLVGTLFLGGVIAFGNFRSTSTHANDVQVQQQQQLSSQGDQIRSLQEQLNKQAVILSAVSEFKQETQTALGRIENKIDRELQYHRNSQQ